MEYLRRADGQDLDLLFHWANEICVRRNSFSSDPIPYEEHVKWFQDLLAQDHVGQYILICNGEAAGQVRVTIHGEEAEVSYSICQEKRGRGYGKQMLGLLKEQIRQDFPEVKKLLAKVKPDNAASQKVFLDMGYTYKYIVYEMETDR